MTLNLREKKRLRDLAEMTPTGVMVREPVPWATVVGFRFQMTPKGAKSWVLVGRLGGKGSPLTIPVAEFKHSAQASQEAHKLAGEMRDQLQAGIDPRKPVVTVVPEVPTLESLWLEYLKNAKIATTTRNNKIKIWNKYLANTLGPLPITDITDQRLAIFLEPIGMTSKSNYDAIQTLISAVWTNRAVIHKLGTNPAKVISKFGHEGRTRILSMDELIRWGEAWKRSDLQAKYAVMVCLLTGCRAAATINICKAKREGNWLIYPKDIVKDGLKSYDKMPIVSRIEPMLENISPDLKYDRLEYCGQSIVRDAGIEDFNLHDLRRTWKSISADYELADPVLEVLMGHLPRKIVRVYTQRSLNPLWAVAEAASEHLADILGL